MILWVILAVITAATVWALVRPLFGSAERPPARADYDRAIYRDQREELRRERERGLLGPAELVAAEREIARRLLAAADPGATAPASMTAGLPPAKAGRPRRWAVAALLLLLPLAALGLYLGLGTPDAPDFPYAQRLAADAQARGMPDLDKAIAKLEARMAEKPDDPKGWVLLARSYRALDRYAKAAEAYEHALKLGDEEPDVAADYADTLVMQAGGVVTEKAKSLFQHVHAVEPADARARFYLALARAQAGDGKGALEDWLGLEADAPKDAPWLPALRAEIKRAAAEFKLDPATLTPTRAAPNISGAPPAAAPQAGMPAANAAAAPGAAPSAEAAPASNAPGPSSAEMAAAANMTPEARSKMVQAMVERLAARLQSQPDDLEGWRRLGHAYRVLGEPAKAVAALEHAVKLKAQDADLLVDYGEALLAAAKPESGKLPPDAVAVMRQVLAIDGARREALWYVGEAEAERGDKQAAAALWGRLLAEMTPGTPDYDRVKSKIDGLGPLP